MHLVVYKLQMGNVRIDENKLPGRDRYAFRRPGIRFRTGRACRLAVQFFVSKDKHKALLTILQLNGNYNRLWEIVKLNGLLPDRKYRCLQTKKVYYGKTLMNLGIFINDLRGNGACRQYEF